MNAHHFILTVLGSGTCAATAERSMAGYHVKVPMQDCEFLLDIGAGSLRRLLEAGESYRKIDAVFITHFHVDHIADLAPLLWSSCYTPDFERNKPLTLIGPPGLKNWYTRLAELHGDWLLDLPFQLDILEKTGATWEWQGMKVSTRALKHSVAVNGYRFEVNSRSLVYTGDTGPCEALIALAAEANVLLAECSFPAIRGEIDFHLTSGSAGEMARQAGVGKLCLTHLYPECEAHDIKLECGEKFDGEIELMTDLQRLII